MPHGSREIPLRRFQHQMIMIRHQRVRMKDHFKTFMDCKAEMEETFVVFLITENLAAFQTAVHHMIKSTGIFDSQRTRHNKAGDYQRR